MDTQTRTADERCVVRVLQQSDGTINILNRNDPRLTRVIARLPHGGTSFEDFLWLSGDPDIDLITTHPDDC